MDQRIDNEALHDLLGHAVDMIENARALLISTDLYEPEEIRRKAADCLAFGITRAKKVRDILLAEEAEE